MDDILAHHCPDHLAYLTDAGQRLLAEVSPPAPRTIAALDAAEVPPPAPPERDWLAEALAWTQSRGAGLTPEERHLLLHLCLNRAAWAGERCPLDHDLLARQTGYSLATIERGLVSLHREQLVWGCHLAADGGEYRLLSHSGVPNGR